MVIYPNGMYITTQVYVQCFKNLIQWSRNVCNVNNYVGYVQKIVNLMVTYPNGFNGDI